MIYFNSLQDDFKRINILLRILIFASILIKGSAQIGYEEGLIKRIEKINLHIRPPVCEDNCSKPVKVNITYNVIQILAFSQSEETLSISGWFTVVWHDVRLRWDQSLFGNLSSISILAKDMWLPDIGVMNVKHSKNFDFSTIAQSRISVEHTGVVTWLHGAVLDVTCPLDVSFFPFDYQTCYLVINPWQSSEKQIIIYPVQRGSAVDNSYLPNSNVSEWQIEAIDFTSKKYRSDLNVSYQYIRVSIHLKRQPLYFVVLVLIPFSMLSGLACLIFTLDDTGDRLSVALSLVLSMTMYVVIVSSNAPRSMRRLPVIGIYLLDQLGLLSLATVLAVINNKIRYFKSFPKRKSNSKQYRCPDFTVDSPIMELRKYRMSCNNSFGYKNSKNFRYSLKSNCKSSNENLSKLRNIDDDGVYSHEKFCNFPINNSEFTTEKYIQKYIYRDLANKLDKFQMIIYLFISFINGIFCLLIMPRYFQNTNLSPPD